MKSNRFQKGLACDLGLNLLSVLFISCHFLSFLMRYSFGDRMGNDSDDQASVVSSDDEASDTDPFRHRIKMSPLRWLRTYLLTPILVPLRFTLLILTIAMAWLVSSISLIGLSQTEILNDPLTGWRLRNKKVSSFLGRLCFR